MSSYGEDLAKDRPEKLLIVDDDVCFGALMSAVAKSRGFVPDYYASLMDMGSFARIQEFDVAIIDYYLGTMRGDEIAEYVDTFFSDVPVIIVSSENVNETRKVKWPACVRCFMPKAQGPAKIVEAARGIIKRDRLLKHFATYSRPGVSNVR